MVAPTIGSSSTTRIRGMTLPSNRSPHIKLIQVNRASGQFGIGSAKICTARCIEGRVPANVGGVVWSDFPQSRYNRPDRRKPLLQDGTSPAADNDASPGRVMTGEAPARKVAAKKASPVVRAAIARMGTRNEVCRAVDR